MAHRKLKRRWNSGDAAGRADDLDGPMFRPLSHNRKGQESRRHMDPDALTGCCESTRPQSG